MTPKKTKPDNQGPFLQEHPKARWLSIDPGEDTGWALWEGGNLIDFGTDKLWEFGMALYSALHSDPMELELVGDTLAQRLVGVTGFVVEDWRIYPKEAKSGGLDWDQCRTARLIGAITLVARAKGLWMKLQPAAIKEQAEIAGAKAYFVSPLNENRHANDAIRHGVYRLAMVRGGREVIVQAMPTENPHE